MNAAEHYNGMVNARQQQQSRLATPFGESYWQRYAHTYRFDPFRDPEPQLSAALNLVEPDDEIIEIGGGAGRIGLPLASTATSLTNVEPSPAMREQFAIAVSEHGISNANLMAANWPLSEPISADVVLTVDVTYFINDIEPFIRAMHDSARRRVIILTWTVAPPNVSAELFRTAFGEEEAPSPGFRELLPVIWNMGIVPDVQVVDQPFTWPEQLPGNEDEAVRFALEELAAVDHPQVEANVRRAIGALFQRGDVYRPAWRTPSQAMLITWRTD
ncbi:MAG: class I SAM-dependent methyltransferase [Chloroflexota bacterium]|nr:class I SAM-dependent methyltransferase [Chloroflexota bacterium]MDE2895036.1 class I SAM-dependent methyltransferase [Chloroflexota bacterium]